MAERKVSIRLSVEDAEVARRALEQFGTRGRQVLEQLGEAGRTATRGADIAAYGAELDRLRAKFNPLFAAQQQYRATLAEIAQAHRVGALTEAEHAAAIQRTKDAFARQVVAIRGGADALTVAGAASRTFRGQMQQLSFQVNDVVSQLSAGVNPMTILVQQGGQIAQIFGPLIGVGGVLVIGAAAAARAFSQIAGETERWAESLKLVTTYADEALKKSEAFAEGQRQIAISDVQQRIAALEKRRADIIARTGLGEDEFLRRAEERRLNPGAFGRVINLIPNEFQSVQRELNELRGAEAGFIQAEHDRRMAEDLEQRLQRIKEIAATEKEAREEAAKAIQQQHEADVRAAVAYDQAREKAHERAQAVIAEDAKRQASLEKYIQGLETAAAAESLSSTEKRVQLALQEAQNRLVDQYGNKVRDLTAEEKARVANAVRHYEAQKELTEEVARAGERAFDRVGGAITEAFVQGKGAVIDFGNIAMGVVSELVQTLLKLAVFDPIKNSLFGGGSGFDLFGAIGSWFSGSTGAVVAHAGARVGAGGPTRAVPTSLFAGARRYHGGGSVLAPGEVPIIAQVGERVLSRAENAAYERGAPVTVQIVDQRRGGAPVETESGRGPDGKLMIRAVIKDEVGQLAADGQLDRTMSTNWAARRAPHYRG